MDRVKNRSIPLSSSLLEAIKKMDSISSKMLFVFNNELFMGLLTIGDIQRAIIKNISLSAKISEILDKHKVYASIEDTTEQICDKMHRMRAECMPVVDDEGNLVNVYFWSDVFGAKKIVRDSIDLPVVIMAGGKGTRLKPLTYVIPKPLIPIGKKTILEEIMDQFEGIGCKNFYMSVNYKYDMIEYYLSQLDKKYDISFFREEKPLVPRSYPTDG